MLPSEIDALLDLTGAILACDVDDPDLRLRALALHRAVREHARSVALDVAREEPGEPEAETLFRLDLVYRPGMPQPYALIGQIGGHQLVGRSVSLTTMAAEAPAFVRLLLAGPQAWLEAGARGTCH